MKTITILFSLFLVFITCTAQSCSSESSNNKTAKLEQVMTEQNQSNLLAVQPPPKISWSLERDNLIKRFKLMNDRGTIFNMYIFLEGVGCIGYYQINKVSSVSSQLTNPQQLIRGDSGQYDGDFVVDSAEPDGSYGTNGSGVFGFTPEDVYIETTLKYLVSTVPMPLSDKKLVVLNVQTEESLKKLMDRINATNTINK